jgi:hypothetical protein
MNFDICASDYISPIKTVYIYLCVCVYRLCGLVVTVPGYRSRDPCSIPGATRFSEK